MAGPHLILGLVATLAGASSGEGPAIELSPLTLMPQPIANFGSAFCDGWLYVYGGHHGRAHDHCIESISDAFYRISLVDRVSVELLPGGPLLQGASLVEHEGQLVRVGGMTARNSRGEEDDLHSSPAVATFDPATRRWTDLPSLRRGRSSHDAGIIDGVLYVAGGWHLNGLDEPVWETEIVALDLARPEGGWSVVGQLPTARRAVDVTVHGGRLFVLGGMTLDEKLSSAVAAFDPRAGSWTEGPDLPSCGFGVSATVVDGVLWASGMDGEIFTLSADGESWSPRGRLAAPRFFHRMERVSADRIAALGGATKGGHLGTIEWIDTRREAGQPRLSEIRLPYPGTAKNRQGAWVEGADLMLFGGNNSAGQHDFEPENFVREGYRLNLATLRFRPAAELPAPRQSITTIRDEAWSEWTYAVGGFGHDGDAARSHDEIHAYHRERDEWEPASARLAEPRTQFEAVVEDGAIWIFGGVDYHPDREEDFVFPMDVLRWKPGMDSVERTAVSMTRPRRAFGTGTVGERTYFIGGMGPEFQVVAECEAFDWTTREWSEIPAPERPRISPEVVTLDDRIYVIGGSSPSRSGEGFEANPSVEVFDPATERWSTVIEVLPFPVRHIQAQVWSGRIVLFAIEGEGGSSIRLVFLDPGRKSGDTVTGTQ